MFSPQPVPDGLLQRALNTAFTTEAWPEWDSLDIVPEFDSDVDLDSFDVPESAAENTADDASESTGDLENPSEAQKDTQGGDVASDTRHDAADPWGDTSGADYNSGIDHLDPTADIDLDDFDF